MGRMARTAVTVILVITVFFLIAVVLVLNQTANSRFEAALRYSKAYRWNAAEAHFAEALSLDPCNAAYAAGYADFLRNAARYSSDKKAALEKADALYGKAIALDPERAWYHAGRAMTRLYAGTPARDIVEDLRAAARKDPGGYAISAAIGYTGIGLWKDLDASGRALTLQRLIATARISAADVERAYAAIWRGTKDMAVMKRFADAVWGNIAVDSAGARTSLPKQAGGTWYLKRGPDRYEAYRAPLYTNATLFAPLDMRRGAAGISIDMKKLQVIPVKAGGRELSFPFVVVTLDGDIIGRLFVDSDDLKRYRFPVQTDGGPKIVGISFVNDVYDPARGEDRNVMIGDVAVDYI